MSIFVSNASKRGIKADVYRSAFAGLDDPKIITPLISIVSWFERNASDSIAALWYSERAVQNAMAKLPGKGYGSIPHENIWSFGRKLLIDVLNNDRNAIQRSVLTSGLYWKYKLPAIGGGLGASISAPMPERMASDLVSQNKAMAVFEKYGTGVVITKLLNAAGLINDLPKVTGAVRADKIKVIEAQLSGTDPEAMKAAAISSVSVLPVIGTAAALVTGLVALFIGNEKKDIAEAAAKEAAGAGKKWQDVFTQVIKLKISDAAVSTEDRNSILTRAQLYCPVNIYGISLEKTLGLPFLAAVYSTAFGNSIMVPASVQETQSPVQIISDTPPPLPGAGPDPVAVVNTITETSSGPYGTSISVEKPVTQAEAELSDGVKNVTADEVAAASATGMTDNQKQWLTVGLAGVGLLTKGFGLAATLLKR